MKTEYNIKDIVWIHLGESALVEGRVVEIIDLDHLNENYDPEIAIYIIEIETGLDRVYEVRPFDQISPTAQGPIALFRNLGYEAVAANRLLKKVGVTLPVDNNAAPASQHTPHHHPKKNKRRYYSKRN